MPCVSATAHPPASGSPGTPSEPRSPSSWLERLSAPLCARIPVLRALPLGLRLSPIAYCTPACTEIFGVRHGGGSNHARSPSMLAKLSSRTAASGRCSIAKAAAPRAELPVAIATGACAGRLTCAHAGHPTPAPRPAQARRSRAAPNGPSLPCRPGRGPDRALRAGRQPGDAQPAGRAGVQQLQAGGRAAVLRGAPGLGRLPHRGRRGGGGLHGPSGDHRWGRRAALGWRRCRAAPRGGVARSAGWCGRPQPASARWRGPVAHRLPGRLQARCTTAPASSSSRWATRRCAARRQPARLAGGQAGCSQGGCLLAWLPAASRARRRCRSP
jgi:hypothetical protein